MGLVTGPTARVAGWIKWEALSGTPAITVNGSYVIILSHPTTAFSKHVGKFPSSHRKVSISLMGSHHLLSSAYAINASVPSPTRNCLAKVPDQCFPKVAFLESYEFLKFIFSSC